MNISAKKLLEEFQEQGIFRSIQNPDNSFSRISSIENARAGDLVFASNEKYARLSASSEASVIITSADFLDFFKDCPATILIAKDVGLAHALVKQKYADRPLRQPGIHDRAIIAETAIIPASATIGAGVVIEEEAVIGEDVVIRPNSVIEKGAIIGARTIIHSMVVIGYDCKIGADVIIKSGSIIGSEGFGFVQDKNRKNHRIPQTGIVVIEDRVIVGANNCIDRAAYEETRIKSGTVFDNLCHVAHNVTIGEDCILTAMFCVAGSTTIGKRLIASGQTGILDHLEITDDVILLHQAGVHKGINKPGPYAGTPYVPLRDYMKNHALVKGLQNLKKDVSELKKQNRDA